ncbi:MAG: polysaccharide biosynthesis protein [Ruminococcaceae bacterium]|nr:polysaccharide biosynthesis protein [Oscillospiraceae bacterium]
MIEERSLGSKKQFLSGVTIMTLSTALVKIIGLLYKIPMLSYLGTDGMAYFNAAYDIYTMFYMISTAGLSVAVSILISENRVRGNVRNIKRIYNVTLALFFVIGSAGMLAMMLGSDRFAEWIKIDESAYCIVAIAPTLFLICISSAMRGYFQGHQIMTPTAVSQVIEALGKLVIGLLLASYALKKGYSLPVVAAFAVLGLTIGVGVSMLYLVITKFLFRATGKQREMTPDSGLLPDTSSSILGNLIKISIPITISSSVMGIARLVDTALISSRLQHIGFEQTIANSMYGAYSTLVVPIYNLPPAIITGIALSLVPMLTAAIEAKNREKESMVLSSSLRICSLFAMPCSVGICLFSKPILELIFSGQREAIDIAYPLLSILGMSVLFACLMTVTNAILQAYKQERKPIISMAVGALVKIIFDYILIGTKAVNIYGAPISTFLCNATVMALNFYFIKKYASSFEGIIKLFYRPFAASVVSIGAAFGVYLLIYSKLGASRLYTIAAIALAAVLYIFAAMLFKAVDEDDIKMLPKGEKIYALLHRVKLI